MYKVHVIIKNGDKKTNASIIIVYKFHSTSIRGHNRNNCTTSMADND